MTQEVESRFLTEPTAPPVSNQVNEGDRRIISWLADRGSPAVKAVAENLLTRKLYKRLLEVEYDRDSEDVYEHIEHIFTRGAQDFENCRRQIEDNLLTRLEESKLSDLKVRFGSEATLQLFSLITLGETGLWPNCTTCEI